MALIKMGTAQDLTQSNSPNAKFDWIMVVGTTGSVVVDHTGGNTTTLAAVPVGVWIPMSGGTNVQTASTAVGIMVV